MRDPGSLLFAILLPHLWLLFVYKARVMAASEDSMLSGNAQTASSPLAICDSLRQGRHPIQHNPQCSVVCESRVDASGGEAITSRLECCPSSHCYVWPVITNTDAFCQPCLPSAQQIASRQSRCDPASLVWRSNRFSSWTSI